MEIYAAAATIALLIELVWASRRSDDLAEAKRLLVQYERDLTERTRERDTARAEVRDREPVRGERGRFARRA